MTRTHGHAMTDLPALNQQFSIPNAIVIEAGINGLPRVAVANKLGAAHVYLHGAHVTHFQPAGEQPVLWVSKDSNFTEGKPIRGGIPLCWPWFGPHRTDTTRPLHGFARIRSWTIISTAQLSDGRSRVELGLEHDAATLALWPYEFSLRLTVTVGRDLEVALTTTNTGRNPFTYDDALHTYFAVADVRQAVVEGLDGVAYFDKVAPGGNKVQAGAVTISGETDRVYAATGARTIVDAAGRRSIAITASGARATVVWNPWIAKAKAMADFGDEEWPGMLCVESANCLDVPVTLLPGTAHTTAASYRVVR